jgi:hypothetical protein
MGKRNAIRTITSLAVTLFVGLCAASCGSSNSSTFNDAGTTDNLPDASVQHGDGGGSGVLTQGNPDATMMTTCTPKTCAELGATCGQNGDTCGGLTANCGTCTSPEFCGGGGASKCGLGFSPDGSVITANPDGGGTSACTPLTCADQGVTCGPAGDGCGSLIVGGCGACPTGQQCGGGGVNGQCVPIPGATQADGSVATLPDGATPPSQCVPLTCVGLGYNCGLAGDGCNGTIDCTVGNPPCTSPQYCGGAGYNLCGGNNGANADGGPTVPPCVPTTCAAQGFTCGQTGDGCGNILNCAVGNPACVSPQFCGGAGANKCGGNNGMTADGGSTCMPTACTSGCGFKNDGCNGTSQCPVTCTGVDVCGGSGVANQCGHCPAGTTCNTTPQPTCEDGGTTTYSGVVKAGVSTWLAGLGITQAPDPVPNVLVYIPNDPTQVAALHSGFTASTCPSCSADVTGNPLTSTYTAFDGTFTLSNVPVGNNIPLIIQMGRWRRQFTVNITGSCSPNGSTTTNVFNLPQNHTQGDIPLTAISTGTADQLECVLIKMGIDQAEFVANTATTGGRIHIYSGGAAGTTDAGVTGIGEPGATVANSNPEASLMQTGGTFMNYDQIMLPCWGDAMSKPASELANLGAYAGAGGHFFATHFSYSWLHNNPAFAGIATWDLGANPNDTGTHGTNGNNFTGNVSTVVPPDPPAPNAGVFAKWLNLVGSLSGTDQVTLIGARHDVDSPATADAVDWIDGRDPNPKAGSSANMLLHFTFNTPVPNGSCGHAIFSDFHVTGSGGNIELSHNDAFPTPDCTQAALSQQEKILEYMIWDLGACAVPVPPVCTPNSCSGLGLQCGSASDGCGNTISCGNCPAGDICSNGTCEPTGCTPATACPANIHCGQWGDGCGGLINCGTCPPGETCGGSGVNGTCGAPPDGGACVPQACPANIDCGPYGDGCGGLVPGGCGTCPPGETCGGGGVNGMCGAPPVDGGACVPQGCPANINCGPWGDGCGGLVPGGCGTCSGNQTCGGGGVNGMCGGGACNPLTCSGLGYNCGMTGDGCGNTLDCGTCPAGQTCGGGGAANVCGAPKTPK